MLVRVATSLAVAAVAAGVVAPASRLSPAIADGVSVGGVTVGGLTSVPARDALERAYARPLAVTYGGRTWTVPRTRFSVAADVDAAVEQALRAPAGARLDPEVRDSPAAVRDFVTKLARKIDKPARDAELAGFTTKPVFTPGRPGVAVRLRAAVRLLERALTTPAGRSVAVPTRPVAPAKTPADFGPVIVIDRGVNTLRLFDGQQLVRAFRVATGQSVYPTPSGLWHIVDKQMNPWWYPPPSPWARGEKPVPPGPGNPLGTRWMGLDAAGVGIHGTPSDYSIGYSASHGCIRMHIPEAEWLFQHVSVGTPVLIR
ncbi:MAG: L,D-transpeptidase family protein [Gaiellaceae bacterium]